MPLDSEVSFSQIEKEYKLINGDEKRRVFFAQYITAFDVPEQTEWWFTVKDSEYDLSKLQAKKRYEITKARKFCVAKKIRGCDYKKELFNCYERAFDVYPKKISPTQL